MHVIEVIPLKKGVRIDTLSYFSRTAYPPGSILTIPVRTNTILGIVVESHEVTRAKAALRAATFSLKKLPEQKNIQSLSPALIETARALAEQHAATVGAILFTLLSPELRNGECAPPHTHHTTPAETHAPEVLQDTKEERHRAYRSLVRETFAHSGSVLCVVPSSAEIEEIEKALSPGIEDRVILLSSARTKRQQAEAYEALEDYRKPKLIVATPIYACIERHDITITILEYARSPHYKMRTRPYLDWRDALMQYAKKKGQRVLLGDLMLRTEDEEGRRTERYHTYGEAHRRIALPGDLTIVHQKDRPDGMIPFALFSEQTIDAIRDTRRRRRRTLLFAPRRGLAPAVACIDCGHIFRSPETGAPYSLLSLKRGNTEERWFVCSSSGHRERAADTCPDCGSWRLRERGIGIQAIQEEFTKQFPHIPLVVFDHTTASTHKKACFLRDTFYKNKNSVLLGTRMCLPYLHTPVETSAVINMDALYATPTWRLQEDNLGLLLTLRELTVGKLYVQTRTDEEALLQHAKKGSIQLFYDEELTLRKKFLYPPYSTFIHLTWQGTPKEADRIASFVTEILKEVDATYYTAPPSHPDTKIMYGLIRVPEGIWPKPSLSATLRLLPPSVRIMINPDRIV
ncbi:hypothetical protein KC727_00995 [Candidatus Kaiserbacteria bacterium]|nr:hypothetical protein [Candidatus Kaiserbacteria bacterium]